jgi:hypothetical protein
MKMDENTNKHGDENNITVFNMDAIIEEERAYSEAIQAAVTQVEVKTRIDGRPVGHKPLENEVESRRITPMMKSFANYIVNGDSATLAYTKAYDCERLDEATVRMRANKLLKDERISLLLEPLYQARKEMVINDERSLRTFVMGELFTHAKEMEGEGAKLKALELMGKSIGLFADKADGERDELDVSKLKAELKAKLNVLLSTDVTPRQVQ